MQGRIRTALAATVAALSLLTGAAAAQAGLLGHGIGLSQRGAAARGEAGIGSRAILNFYYPGSLPQDLGGPVVVRVWFYDAPAFHVRSAPAYPDGADVTVAGGAILVDGQAVGTSLVLDGPVCLRKCYRGSVVATLRSAASTSMHVRNVVPLEEYLRSVVASEMPTSWPRAALRAQAIAARTYALASLRADRDWDVYQDTRSQAYWGMEQETPRGDDAVASTAGRIRAFDATPILAMYSAGNGGWTHAVDGYPYLVRRRDLFDLAGAALTARQPHLLGTHEAETPLPVG